MASNQPRSPWEPEALYGGDSWNLLYALTRRVIKCFIFVVSKIGEATISAGAVSLIDAILWREEDAAADAAIDDKEEVDLVDELLPSVLIVVVVEDWSSSFAVNAV